MQADLERVPFPVLIGDIGGTNARFALIADETAPAERLPTALTNNFATIDAAIAEGVLARTPLRPKTAILALAGPITGDAVLLTNRNWMVKPKDLIAQFGFEEAILLNDFEAQSLCLPDLQPEDLDAIGGGIRTVHGTRLVVGPGTGLGAGALIFARHSWIPVPGEGGHIELGPITERDMALWPHLERLHGRISSEAILSGAGILRLYRGIAALEGRAPAFSDPADVTTAGLSGSDPLAVETLHLFATYLGRFAGDLALVFMPRGGVYLAGGIPAKIAPALKTGAFREAFVAKEPHREIIETLATSIVVKTDAALAGIAAFARQPTRFSLDLAGRWWRG